MRNVSFSHDAANFIFQTLGSNFWHTGLRSLWTGRDSIHEDDQELSAIIKKEKNRQVIGLELIASEVRQMSCKNVVFEQVRLKPSCTFTEDGKRLVISDLSRRRIVLSE